MSRIIVKEDSDPLLTVRLKKRVPEGGTIPYLLDGNPEVEFIVKDALDAASPLFTYSKTAGEITIVDDGAGVGDKYSEITVQCAAADLAAPATHYFSLAVTKSGKRDVVMHGFFEISDI